MGMIQVQDSFCNPTLACWQKKQPWRSCLGVMKNWGFYHGFYQQTLLGILRLEVLHPSGERTQANFPWNFRNDWERITINHRLTKVQWFPPWFPPGFPLGFPMVSPMSAITYEAWSAVKSPFLSWWLRGLRGWKYTWAWAKVTIKNRRVEARNNIDQHRKCSRTVQLPLGTHW